ncbi:hypothetical protein AB6P02_01470 [Streptococcus mutans]|uniref:hypothetical protein n=1 Tax=Streptococcus mutans TaxID=1309 RepID=UPI001455A9E3|nr:hypothetical protein [Streptococcus mutans]MCB5153089.1 hypothetical protein [Streptococcus mutans]NLQ43662.1 hypothetical protein [Streptococcus mutans]
MNTVTLNSMAFDNFEAVDGTLLSNIEAGNITWNGFVGATAEGAWTGAVGGVICDALAGIAVGVATVAAAPETAGSSIGVGVKAGVPVALAGLAIHCPGLPAWV